MNKIRQIIADILGKSVDELSDSISIGDIPQWDSLMQLIIISSLESEFGFQVNPDDMEELTSIGGIINYFISRGNVAESRELNRSHSETPNVSSNSDVSSEECSISSIVEQILNHAKNSPSSLALVCENESYTYQQLARAINKSALYLLEKKIQTGDVIALYADREIGFISSYFGSQLIGVASVILDPEIKETTLYPIISQTKPRIILGSGILAHFSYDQLNKFAPKTDSQIAPSPSHVEEISDIIFTTGTTGTPKGVTLTQSNIAASAKQINDFVGTNKEDVEVVALPICRSFGLGRIRCILSVGGTVVLAPGFANPTKLLDIIKDFKTTGIAMVPANWAYLNLMSGEKISKYATNLRYIELGSAFMSISAKQQLMRLFPNTRICMHYGLTEASRSTFIEFHEDAAHLDSVGKPSPGVDIRIFSEDGDIVETGKEGEICIKGNHVMKGYLNNTESDVWRGDYFRSGDRGRFDMDGYLYLSGRSKDMINVGGKKVSPEEVESVLNTISGISESACVPAPDPQGILGEVVKAILVPVNPKSLPSDDEIKKQLFSKLEQYKIPYYIEWREQLIYTDSGKIQRHLMR